MIGIYLWIGESVKIAWDDHQCQTRNYSRADDARRTSIRVIRKLKHLHSHRIRMFYSGSGSYYYFCFDGNFAQVLSPIIKLRAMIKDADIGLITQSVLKTP
jgi:hypothetical protein